jgi:hypothetical protein
MYKGTDDGCSRRALSEDEVKIWLLLDRIPALCCDATSEACGLLSPCKLYELNPECDVVLKSTDRPLEDVELRSNEAIMSRRRMMNFNILETLQLISVFLSGMELTESLHPLPTKSFQSHDIFDITQIVALLRYSSSKCILEFCSLYDDLFDLYLHRMSIGKIGKQVD